MNESLVDAGTQTARTPSGTKPAVLGTFARIGGRWRFPHERVQLPIGVIGALVAEALLWLVAAVTDLSFLQRLSAQFFCRHKSSSVGCSGLVVLNDNQQKERSRTCHCD
jgi:hypothetical protein